MYTSVFHRGCSLPNFVVEPSRAESSRAEPRAHPRHVRELIDARIRVRCYMACEQGCERARTSATNDDDESPMCAKARDIPRIVGKSTDFTTRNNNMPVSCAHAKHKTRHIFPTYSSQNMQSHNFSGHIYIFQF